MRYYGTIICKRKKKKKTVIPTTDKLVIYTLCNDKKKPNLYQDYNKLLYEKTILKIN